MGFLSRLKQLFRPAPPPVGLGIALGSGGAKGMAHLGALKAFEEAGITFSFVAGTSMGAVVGALLAKGYSAEDMRRIVEAVNRREFSRNLRPFAHLAFAEHMQAVGVAVHAIFIPPEAAPDPVEDGLSLLLHHVG